ncbi:hypothetical protein FG386_002074 [Cryptosporidium ryanae]|uniref:uncharacterized protein n=1 Tax=Cryptosporidium ryanae TaxID=515981 RepID=UPI00351AA4DE|nr:hypothetical protein FG386_002074 [Cryptosporidium ryanae]
MAQNYIYDQEYVKEMNEQAYNEITSNNGSNTHKFSKNIHVETKSGNILSEIGSNVEDGTHNISSEMKEKLYNSLTGLGLVILILFIIYLFNKTLFWFIIATFCISCYLVTVKLGSAENTNNIQVNQNV